MTDPQHTHVFEQARAAMTEMACLIWCYFSELRDQGFTQAQAFVLARDYQTDILRRAELEDEEEEL